MPAALPASVAHGNIMVLILKNANFNNACRASRLKKVSVKISAATVVI